MLDQGFWADPLAELERLAGPLHVVDGPVTAFQVLEGSYRGERVRATWTGRVRSGGARGSTLVLAVALGGLPIRCYVWARARSTVLGPTATSGDATFDERYVVAARPVEVVAAALDAEVRQMVERRWDGRDTSLDVDDGWVMVHAATSRPGPHGERRPPSGPELQAVLDDLVLVATRLRSSWYATRAAIVASQGEAAAAAWEQAAVEDLEDRGRAARMLAVGIVGASLLLILLVVLAVAAAF